MAFTVSDTDGVMSVGTDMISIVEDEQDVGESFNADEVDETFQDKMLTLGPAKKTAAKKTAAKKVTTKKTAFKAAVPSAKAAPASSTSIKKIVIPSAADGAVSHSLKGQPATAVMSSITASNLVPIAVKWSSHSNPSSSSGTSASGSSYLIPLSTSTGTKRDVVIFDSGRANGLQFLIPLLKDVNVKGVIISHTDNDHISGITSLVTSHADLLSSVEFFLFPAVGKIRTSTAHASKISTVINNFNKNSGKCFELASKSDSEISSYVKTKTSNLVYPYKKTVNQVDTPVRLLEISNKTYPKKTAKKTTTAKKTPTGKVVKGKIDSPKKVAAKKVAASKKLVATTKAAAAAAYSGPTVKGFMLLYTNTGASPCKAVATVIDRKNSNPNFVSLLIGYKGKSGGSDTNYLFTGDANAADVIVDEKAVKKGLGVSTWHMIEIPHHGSDHSTKSGDSAFFGLSNGFFVTGAGNSHHPGPGVMASLKGKSGTKITWQAWGNKYGVTDASINGQTMFDATTSYCLLTPTATLSAASVPGKVVASVLGKKAGGKLVTPAGKKAKIT